MFVYIVLQIRLGIQSTHEIIVGHFPIIALDQRHYWTTSSIFTALHIGLTVPKDGNAWTEATVLMRSTAHVHHITQVGATDHTIVTKLNKTIVKENTKRIKNSVLAG